MKDALTNIFTNLRPVFQVLLEGKYIFSIYGLNSSSNIFGDFVDLINIKWIAMPFGSYMDPYEGCLDKYLHKFMACI
jgi:hypothetical protein